MPRPPDYPDDLLRMAATLYHVDGLDQQEVARLVRVSQAKVSRLLASALERGIVRISVEQYEAREARLEHAICSRFGVREAIVVRVADGEGGAAARETVGHFGAPAVMDLLPAGGTLAVGGGRSVADVVQRFRGGRGRRFTVVQAMGSIDSSITAVDSLEIGRAIVKRWGGSLMTLSTPAFAADKRTRDSFLASEQIRRVWQLLRQADAALVGVGGLTRSVYVERGIFPAAEMGHLRDAGAVGEICGRFFDRQGRECRSRWRDRCISIELPCLRRIPQVIGVAAGADRAPAVAAALRGGLLRSLLIDDHGARALLEQ